MGVGTCPVLGPKEAVTFQLVVYCNFCFNVNGLFGIKYASCRDVVNDETSKLGKPAVIFVSLLGRPTFVLK